MPPLAAAGHYIPTSQRFEVWSKSQVSCASGGDCTRQLMSLKISAWKWARENLNSEPSSKMVSRRKILSRSRDELHSDIYFMNEDDDEDVWFSKEKLYRVSPFTASVTMVCALLLTVRWASFQPAEKSQQWPQMRRKRGDHRYLWESEVGKLWAYSDTRSKLSNVLLRC